MNKLFLWLVGLLNPLWRSIGADPQAIGHILKTKLLMDDRGGMVMGRRQQSKKGMEYMTYFFVGLFGVFLVMLFRICNDVPTAIGIGLSFWVCYIGLMLITEMSENLFDQRDLYVLMSRPIEDMTLSVSRILHIAVFASKFALCLGIPSFLYLLFMVGVWPALVYFLLGILAVCITMTATLVFYLVLLRRVPPARLKKVVGYFQIVTTFVFFMAYQLPSLLEDVTVLQDAVLVDRIAGFSFPGLWLGGLYKVLTMSGAGPLAYAQGGVALITAMGGAWYYVQQSRGYADRLLNLRHSSETQTGADKKTETLAKASPWRDRLAGWLTRPDQERVSFRFHWNVMTRDMTFKQRTYPVLVYLPVILGLSVFRDVISGEEEFQLGIGLMLMLLYFLLWIVIIPLGQTKISENYRASWIFEATANGHPERIRYGQLAAVLSMFFLPMATLVYGVILVFWGPQHWLDILLGLGSVLLFALIYNSIDSGHPFSRAKDDSKFQNFGPFLLIGFLASIFGFGHYALRAIPYIIPLLTIVVWSLVVGWRWWMIRLSVK